MEERVETYVLVFPGSGHLVIIFKFSFELLPRISGGAPSPTATRIPTRTITTWRFLSVIIFASATCEPTVFFAQGRSHLALRQPERNWPPPPFGSGMLLFTRLPSQSSNLNGFRRISIAFFQLWLSHPSACLKYSRVATRSWIDSAS